MLAIVGDRAHAYVSTRHSAAPVPAQMDTGGRDAWSARRGGSERIACRNVIGGPASTVFASRTEVAGVGRASLVTNAGIAFAICMGKAARLIATNLKLAGIGDRVGKGESANATRALPGRFATSATRGWLARTAILL